MRIRCAWSPISLLRMDLGAKLRRSLKVSIGFGHLSNQLKSTSACCLGCCWVFSSAGASSAKENRSPLVRFAIEGFLGVLRWATIVHEFLVTTEVDGDDDVLGGVAGLLVAGVGGCS